MEAAGDKMITEGAHVEIRLFGEVELRAADRLLDVGTPRQQAVLAALVVDAGRPVAAETLIDRIWNDGPPVEARNVLYSHVSRIRRLLGQAALHTGGAGPQIGRRHAGYILDIDPDMVDLHRFSRLVGNGNDLRRGDADRASVLAEALGLWRGSPLAALSGPWAEQVRARWSRLRVDAVVRWAQVELRLGHPAPVVAVLHDLVPEYPLVEPLEGLLMRALWAAGRDAEAIDRYSILRRRLAENLGTDPSVELRDLHRAIMRGEPPPEPAAPTGGPDAPPAQLPPDTPGFTGRDRELSFLDDLTAKAHDRALAVVIIAISGTAGIGKTALAVHWAHRVRDKFTDGQLYVNLRGFDPTGPPVPPAEVVRRFLDALEVPAQRIPASFAAQVGLYRSLLSGRRILVVLDNARDAEQIRPLLPGEPGCQALVTSRNQLAGLVTEGAHPLTLDLLSAAESREFLARRLGPDRVAAEPRAVAEIITLCARLPLALAIMAARAATHPRFGLDVLATDLRAARGGLDTFAGSDPATDARAVFSWSYRQLSPGAARLFRLLGLHPGPDVATPAAASLAGLPAGTVRPLLGELAQAHLIAEHLADRFTFHDLLRVYAKEQADILDTDAERDAAMRRTLSHYVHSADPADRLLNPHREDPPPLPPVVPGVGPEQIADHEQALAWFGAQHRVLLAVIHEVSGFDADVWRLAWALRRFFDYQGHWHDSLDVLSIALRAAQRLADPPKQAFAHCFLGGTYIRFDRYDDARTHLQNALDLYRRAGDNAGEANAHRYYSWLLERQGRYREATSSALRALGLFRAAGVRSGQARSLNAIGWFHALLGHYEEALGFCQEALGLQQELGDRLGQAETWDSLGYAHSHLDRHARAVECYRAAVELYRQIGYRYNEADVWASLGDAHHAAGDTEAARTAWRYALDVLDQLGHADADEVRTKLKSTEPVEDPAINPTSTDGGRGGDPLRGHE
jgi:DNA-binding SARP family transcriptional activator/tetratricopeptide (TPR) repeat protein